MNHKIVLDYLTKCNIKIIDTNNAVDEDYPYMILEWKSTLYEIDFHPDKHVTIWNIGDGTRSDKMVIVHNPEECVSYLSSLFSNKPYKKRIKRFV